MLGLNGGSMSYKLGVVVIHGIGEQKASFADGFIREIKDRLGAHAQYVCLKPLFWADLVEPKETELLARLGAHQKLGWGVLRSLVVHFLADAVAYQRVPENVVGG